MIVNSNEAPINGSGNVSVYLVAGQFDRSVPRVACHLLDASEGFKTIDTTPQNTGV